MNSFLLLGIIIWIYLLSVVRRARLTAFSFLVGSVGCFFVLMTLSTPYWVWFFTHGVIDGVAIVEKLIKMGSVYPKYGWIYITNQATPVTLQIDYECSGIIETMAYMSLLLFYPTYSRKEKFFYSILGLVWIYLANVIRLIIVVAMVYLGGADVFYLAHSILGRLVFYLLIIVLYYNVFTYSHWAQEFYKLFKKKVRSV